MMQRLAQVACLLALVSSCAFKNQADAQFGDQNFKTAVALIELHKVRTGAYPESLRDLQFIGDWDRIPLTAVEYHRLDGGYELNLTRGWMGRPEMQYPAGFWEGLGCLKSNVKRGP